MAGCASAPPPPPLVEDLFRDDPPARRLWAAGQAGDLQAKSALAGLLLARGHPEAAEAQAREGLDSHPYSLPLLLVLAQIQAAQGKSFLAMGTLEKVLLTEPESHEARVELAAIYLDKGKQGQAVLLLESLPPCGFLPEGALRLLDLHFRARRLDLAGRMLACRNFPESREKRLAAIELDLHGERYPQALQALEEAQELYGNQADFLGWKLTLFALSARWKELQDALDAWEAQTPLSPGQMLYRVLALQSQGKMTRAHALLREVLSRAPGNREAFLLLLRHLQAAGRPETMLARLQTWEERNPEDQAMQAWKALAHFMLGEEKLGEISLGMALELDPVPEMALYLRAWRALSPEHPENPRFSAHLAKLRERNPRSMLLPFLEGVQLIQKGDYPGAQDLLESLSGGESPAFLFARARLAHLLGDAPASAAWSSRLLRFGLRGWQVRFLHGKAMLRQGKLAEAAAELPPMDAWPLYHLRGRIQEEEGQQVLALQTYAEGFSRFPQALPLLEGLTRLLLGQKAWSEVVFLLEEPARKPGSFQLLFLERLRHAQEVLGQSDLPTREAFFEAALPLVGKPLAPLPFLKNPYLLPDLPAWQLP